jgi:Domain of unknown function (DUF6487)
VRPPMARSFEATCPSCAHPMESGVIGTNGKPAWQQRASRLSLDGETVGQRVITTVQNYVAWRCPSCRLILFDYNHAL